MATPDSKQPENRLPLPSIMPLGTDGLLLRYGSKLGDSANRAAVATAQVLARAEIAGVIEVVPSLISVYLKYAPETVSFDALAGQVRLHLSAPSGNKKVKSRVVDMAVTFGGEAGPDLEEAASACGLDPEAFIAAHNKTPLRVLATGFAPGFVYCGFHPPELQVPRRTSVRQNVQPGSILFAAGQTAITATTVPTGWHVIGRTEFRNFDPASSVPTRLVAGDAIKMCRA